MTWEGEAPAEPWIGYPARRDLALPFETEPVPYRDEHHEDWEDEFDVEEYEDNSDGDDSDEEPTVPCPNCRALIHEDAPRCPHCGEYVTDEGPPDIHQPWWIILGALAVVYLVYRWTFG